MSKVKEEVPALYKMVWQTYSTASYLYFNEEVILSQEGVQQGDPLGPFLFSLGVRELMNSCSSESNIGYLDDATLADKPEIVLADLKKIVSTSRTLGLQVNAKKYEVYKNENAGGTRNPATELVLDEIKLQAPNIKLLTDDQLTLLGAPVLNAAADSVLMSKY